MKSWLPDAVSAEADTAVLHQRVHGEVARLCAGGQASPGAQAATERCAAQTPHPILFQRCFDLRERLAGAGDCADPELADPDRLLCAVEASRARSCGGERRFDLPTDIAPPAVGLDATLERALTMARAANGVDCDVELVTELDDELAQVLSEAVRLLRRHWPDMRDEIAALLRQLFIFRSERVIGFVDFRSHGSIWLRESAVRQPLQLAEELIHEVSHVRLNGAHAVRPLFLNDDAAIYTSPLRHDRRSMFGVFHQMFVLTRLRAFYRRVLAAGLDAPGPLRNGLTVTERLDAIAANHGASLGIVRAHAELTADGARIVASIREAEVVG